MSITEYEQRLKACNPKLHVKRFGTSKAAIHLGTRFICRIGQGDLPPYNVFQAETGVADQYKTAFNPTGTYKWKRMTKRGRAEAAKIMYTSGCIRFNQIAKVS